MSQSLCSLSNLSRLWRGRVPGQLIIQMTDKCNAQCPQCGMRAPEKFKRSTLSNDDVKRIIDTAASRGVRALSFTGGEPLLLLDSLAELIRYAGAAGIPFIRTGTNGYWFRSPEAPSFMDRVRRVADTLAETPLRNFWISIDSVVPQVHEQMRGFPGLIRGIERALPEFHARGIYPSANLGINRNAGGEATWDLTQEAFESETAYLDHFGEAFRSALRRFYGFVRDLGFTMVNTCYPMSIDAQEQANGLEAVYGATATNRIVRFSRAEKARIFQALFQVVPEFRSELRVFSPLVSLYTLMHAYAGADAQPYACRGGIDFFFVDARDGNTYPCGYRGQDNLGRFENLALDKLDLAATCAACDWECFRDPSELLGPFVQMVTSPLALIKKFWNDRTYRYLWFNDLRYYRACGFFDGRTPPETVRIRAFRLPGQSFSNEPAFARV